MFQFILIALAAYFLFSHLQGRKFRLKIVPLLGNPITSSEIQSLTPITINPNSVRVSHLSIGGRPIYSKSVQIQNGVYVCTCRIERVPIKLYFYNEGFVVKYRKWAYITPFDDTNETICEKYYRESRLHHEDDFNQLKLLLEGDYYYEYTETTYTETTYENDTRHYTKSGNLDKRYSKQNLQTGRVIRSSSTFAKEKVYVHAGYLISVGSIRLVLVTPFGKISEQITNAVHGIVGEEVTSKSGVALQTYSPKVVPYLTDVDRQKIKELLSKEYFDHNSMNLLRKIVDNRREQIKRGDGVVILQKIY